MKRVSLIFALLTLSFAGLHAQDNRTLQLKPYGFVRSFLSVDSRESVFGADDFYYYLPKDENVVDGVDLNRQTLVSFGVISSRLGFDFTGVSFNGWSVGGKFETDFMAGVTGVTGTALLRLRQSYLSLGRGGFSLKVGQAWHPMAADIPTLIAINAGAPFGPFSRAPEIVADLDLTENLSLTAAAIWQMQFT